MEVTALRGPIKAIGVVHDPLEDTTPRPNHLPAIAPTTAGSTTIAMEMTDPNPNDLAGMVGVGAPPIGTRGGVATITVPRVGPRGGTQVQTVYKRISAWRRLTPKTVPTVKTSMYPR